MTGAQGCCFASLGGKERENKAVTSLGKPEIHSLISLAFFLVFVQGGKEVGFDNFIVDTQEWELRGYPQILPFSVFPGIPSTQEHSTCHLLSPFLKWDLSHQFFRELMWDLPLLFQIFCSRCSSHSAPLPRYGQMKPVRVCTHCYMFHVTPFYSDKAGIWRIKLLVCLLESYMDWDIWPKPRLNLKEGPCEGV